jgi:multiple sugar transport system permease protein
MGRDWILGYLLLLPAIAVLVGLIAYPFLYAIYLSVQNKPIGAPGTFVGFQNFLILWSSPTFYQVIRNTLIVMVVGVGLKFLAGLMLALILNEGIKYRELWRALLFFPWTIPIVVSGFSWRWILDDMNGVLGRDEGHRQLSAVALRLEATHPPPRGAQPRRWTSSHRSLGAANAKEVTGPRSGRAV